jgi:DNA-binding CsgD family transcriptional regulator/tetratricopeptide (TPR) repeat protein
MVNTTSQIVGRERELQILHAQYNQAMQDGVRVVVLAGEPGIGKTVLLQALSSSAVSTERIILRGSTWDAVGRIPYLPFLEAFGQYLRSIPLELLHTQVGQSASILASLFPEIALRIGPQPATYVLPADQTHLRLFDAIGELFIQIAAPHGMLLLLDDLHAADSASLDLLAHLIRQLRSHQTRILIAAAYRPGEIAYPEQFERSLVEINRWRCLIRLEIGSLSAAAIGSLASTLLDAPLAVRDQEFLATLAEGNPFFAEELISNWRDTHQLVVHEHSWKLRKQDHTDIPTAIDLAVRQRLNRLQPEVLYLLACAALLGQHFEASALATITVQDLALVKDQLQIARKSQIIRLNQQGTWQFSSSIARHMLEQALSVVERQQLHLRAGQLLETQPHANDAQKLAILAFHFAQSSDTKRAIPYALQSAALALELSAITLAAEQYQTACSLLDGDDPRYGQTILDLAQAQIMLGAEADAIQLLIKAQRWCIQHEQPALAAQSAHRRGQALARLERHTEARMAFAEALALIGEQLNPLVAHILIDSSSLLTLSLHQYEDGFASSARALELANRLEDERLIAAASRCYGTLLGRTNHLERSVVLLEQALKHAIAADDPVEAAECCASLAMINTWRGKLQRAIEDTERRVVYARRCYDPFQLRHTAMMLTVFHSMQGHLVEADRYLTEAAEQIEQLASPEPQAFLTFVRGMLAHIQGEQALAETLLADAIAQFRQIGPGALVWYLGSLGLVQSVQGATARAGVTVSELEQLLTMLPADSMATAEPLAYLTMIALQLDDRPRLARYATQLAPFRGQYHDFLVDRLLGEIALRDADLVAAEALLAIAADIAIREHIPIELAYTRIAQAQLEQRLGRSSQGKITQLITEACTIFESLGNVARAQSLRQQFGSHRPAAKKGLPAGLSTREAEVLRLVAQGKSNREIAHALVLSEKTVANHIANIFAKTGAENRSAATAFAIRQGLA